MISSDDCKQLVAGNYDVIINDNPSSTTMKSAIANFLEHFTHHENGLNQPDGAYSNEFKLLKEYSKTLKEDKANLLDGEMDYNQKKNRYKDIIPFNHTRVILNGNSESEPGSSYINANYIRGPSGSPRAYIACQGPLACTLNDFWRMIWECNLSVIIMACNEYESGKPKCELYWPLELDTSQIFGNIQVALKRERQINSDFLIRKFSVKLLEPLIYPNQQQQRQQVINNNGNAQMTFENCHDIGSLTNNNNQFVDNHQRHHHQYHQTKNINYHLDNHRQHNLSKQNGSTGNSSTSNESINTDEFIQNSNPPMSLQAGISSDPNCNLQSINQTAAPIQRKVLMERTICQFHYTTWPDHGVPDSVHPILELVRLVREVQPAEDKPILVHCSAGCGRTGTICCIDYVWGLLRRGKLNADFNLCSIISEMRQQRMAMVQTLEQYVLCHRAVAALFMQQLQLIGDDDVSVDDESCPNGIELVPSAENEDDKNEEEEKHDDDDDDENLGPVFI